MIDFLARREQILTAHKKLQATRGSGWHIGDATAKEREEKGELELSDRPIALQDDETIHLVGPCVNKIKDAILAFFAKVEHRKKVAAEKGWEESDMIGSGLRYQDMAMRNAKKMLAQDGHIEVDTRTWNYVNSILGVQNIQVVMATAEVQDWGDDNVIKHQATS